MGAKYSKLRFEEFAKAAALGAIAGAVALQPVAAKAATGSVEIHAGNATWFVNTNITFSTTSSGGLAFSEATLHANTASQSDTHNTSTRHDAFDGALTWHVNAGVPGSLENGGYQSPGGTVSVTANSVVGTTQVMAGLNVHVELYFASAKAVARSMLVLQNPTGAPITVTVDNDTNMGSDNDTTYHLTSSGDATYDASDNWTISCQPDPGHPALCLSDPVLTFAFSQTGAPVRPTAIQAVTNGSDKQYFRYTVTVPAGGTQRLLEFVQLSDTVAHATTDAALFNSTGTLQSSGYLAGLSPTEQAQIVNWVVNPTPVPTLSQWALAGMAGLLGLFGLGSAGAFGRKRKRARTV